VPDGNDPNNSHGFCLLSNVALGAAYARAKYGTEVRPSISPDRLPFCMTVLVKHGPQESTLNQQNRIGKFARQPFFTCLTRTVISKYIILLALLRQGTIQGLEGSLAWIPIKTPQQKTQGSRRLCES